MCTKTAEHLLAATSSDLEPCINVLNKPLGCQAGLVVRSFNVPWTKRLLRLCLHPRVGSVTANAQLAGGKHVLLSTSHGEILARHMGWCSLVWQSGMSMQSWGMSYTMVPCNSCKETDSSLCILEYVRMCWNVLEYVEISMGLLIHCFTIPPLYHDCYVIPLFFQSWTVAQTCPRQPCWGYAKLSGFDGDDDDWAEEYEDLCAEQGWNKDWHMHTLAEFVVEPLGISLRFQELKLADHEIPITIVLSYYHYCYYIIYICYCSYYY